MKSLLARQRIIARWIGNYNRRGYPYTTIARMYETILAQEEERILEALGLADTEVPVGTLD